MADGDGEYLGISYDERFGVGYVPKTWTKKLGPKNLDLNALPKPVSKTVEARKAAMLTVSRFSRVANIRGMVKSSGHTK